MSTVTILRWLGLRDIPNLMGLLLLRLVRPLIFTIIGAFHIQAYHRGREKWWDWATLNAVKVTVPTKFQLFFLTSPQTVLSLLDKFNFQNSRNVYFWQFWPVFSLFWWKSRFSGALNLPFQKTALSLANIIIISWKILSHDIHKSIYIFLNDLLVLTHMNAFT